MADVMKNWRSKYKRIRCKGCNEWMLTKKRDGRHLCDSCQHPGLKAPGSPQPAMPKSERTYHGSRAGSGE